MQKLFLRETPGEQDRPSDRPRRLRQAYESLIVVFNKVGFELAVVPDEETPEDASVDHHVFVIPGAARRVKPTETEAPTEEPGSSIMVTFGVDEADHQYLSVTDAVIREKPVVTLLPYQLWVAIGLVEEEFGDYAVPEPQPDPQLEFGHSGAQDDLRVAI